jgi:nuclear GTP-binding protein
MSIYILFLVELIVRSCHKEQLMMLYNIPKFESTGDFLVQIAQKKGKLKKGGIADLDAAARTVLNDWNAGKITYFTLPPQNTKLVSSTSVVNQLSDEFNLKEYDGAILEGIDAPAMEDCVPMVSQVCYY